MPPDSNFDIGRPRLLRFQVPGLDDLFLGIMLPQVAAISSLQHAEPVPFAPPSVLGISQWGTSLIAIVDLAAALLQVRTQARLDWSGMHFLIARVPIRNRIEVLGCPILREAAALHTPQEASRPTRSYPLNPLLIHDLLILDGYPTALLNLEGLWGMYPS